MRKLDFHVSMITSEMAAAPSMESCRERGASSQLFRCIFRGAGYLLAPHRRRFFSIWFHRFSFHWPFGGFEIDSPSRSTCRVCKADTRRWLRSAGIRGAAWRRSSRSGDGARAQHSLISLPVQHGDVHPYSWSCQSTPWFPGRRWLRACFDLFLLMHVAPPLFVAPFSLVGLGHGSNTRSCSGWSAAK